MAKKKPKIICICGSTKIADYHVIYKWKFEKLGCICLTINYLPEWYVKEMKWEPHHVGEQSGLKEHLDELHLRKIDLSDELFIINKDGYIGESTRNEINYAKKLGKPVVYMEG